MRKTYSSKFKFEVALAALKEEKPLAQLSKEVGVHRVQITQWRKQLEKELPHIFSKSSKEHSKQENLEGLCDELYKQIGQLKVENDFLKKKSKPFT